MSLGGVQVLDEWNADGRFLSRKLDGASSTRRIMGPVMLRKGDRITIEGVPGGSECAPLDYVEISPVPPPRPEAKSPSRVN